MSQVVIGDILPYTQATATLGQTVFGTNWTANVASDVVVYYTPVNTAPNDVTQMLNYPADYSVAFIGGSQQVQVTLTTPAAANGDIVTITRQTPADRLNLYTNTNFTPSMLNNDFGILTLVDQQAQLVDQKIGPRYNYSATIVDVVDTILPILLANQTWAKNPNNTGFVGYTLPPVTSGIAPADATYITQTANASLPNSQALSALGANAILAWNNGTHQITATDILGTANQIAVANGDGNGTIGLSIPANPIMPGVAGMGIPEGTTAQRVIPASNISLRYNTDLQDLEYWDGSTWIQLGDANLSGIPIVLEAASALVPNGFVLTAGSGVTLTPGAGTLTVSATGTGGTVTSFAFINGGGFTGVVSNPTTTPTLSLTGAFLPLAGGTMAGNIDMASTYKVINAIDPTNPQDYATKNYVDTTALNGTSVYAASAGSLGTVLQVGAGVGATLTNAGAQATFALDGVNPPVGSNVLIKNTATGMTAANEGIYTVTNAGSAITNWILTRATDYDTPTEINNTGLIIIQNGSTLAGQAWYNTATIATVDTTAFSYSRFGTTGTVTSITAGTGLTGGTITTSGTIALDSTLPAGLTIPQPIIQGITSGSAPSAGDVGEIISSQVTIASATGISNNTITQLTTISLTAGYWMVTGNVTYNNAAATIFFGRAWASLTHNTLPDLSLIASAVGNGQTTEIGMVIPTLFVNVSSTTTVYLTAYVQFNTGPTTMGGQIQALRIG